MQKSANKKSFILGGLSKKMFLVYESLFMIVLAIFSLFMFTTTKNNIDDSFEKDSATMENSVYAMMKTIVDTNIKTYLIEMARTNRLLAAYYYRQYTQGKMREKEAYARFKKIILDEKYGKIGDTGYLAGVSSKGILTIHPKSEGVDASKFDFMQKATKLKNGYLEYEWKNKGETIARNKAGGLAYFKPWDLIIWASSYKSEFSDLINVEMIKKETAKVKVGKNGYVFIMDGNGKMIYHPVLQDKIVLDKMDKNGKHIFKDIINKKEGVIVTSLGLSGNKKYKTKTITFKYYPDMDWYVSTVAFRGEYYAPLYKMVRVIIVMICVVFFVLLLVNSLIIFNLLKPLRNMNEVVNYIAEGDFRGKIEVFSNDEIGEIARNFNRLIVSFSEIISTIKSQTSILYQSIQDLTITTQENSSTSNQQAASIKEIVSTMEDSNSLTLSISKKINGVAAVSEENKKLVEKGVSIVEETIQKMNEIKESNANNIENIKTLVDKIENIGEIVNIINNIADQTKIIAFNAELEASAAGEFGKNFQIVASEIRRLANNTVSSTGEIKTKIDEVQHSSDVLIDQTDKATESIKEGWSLSSNLKGVFDNIITSSNDSAASASQIAISTNQQTEAFGQILLTLKQISEGVDNFVITTTTTTEASAKINDIVTELNNLIARFKVNEKRDNNKI